MMDMMWVVFCSVSFVSMCGGEVLDNRIGSCSKGYANGAVEKAWESMDSDSFLVSPYKRQRVSPFTDSTTKRTHTHTHTHERLHRKTTMTTLSSCSFLLSLDTPTRSKGVTTIDLVGSPRSNTFLCLTHCHGQCQIPDQTNASTYPNKC